MNTVSMGLKLMEESIGKVDIKEMENLIKDARTSSVIALEILNEILLADKMSNQIIIPEFSFEEPIKFILDTVSPFTIQVIDI
jgi:hypothetical protein